MKATAARVECLFRERGVVLTLGAEPTCVPPDPRGAEWNFAATGPTKLARARRLASALVATALPGAATIFAPGKTYPGEINPRWALHLVARRDGSPLWTAPRARRRATAADVAEFFAALGRLLGVKARPQKLSDPVRRGSAVWVWPLDRPRRGWAATDRRWPRGTRLLATEGPAGLRLPWERARGRGARRALTVGLAGGRLEIFLPPLRQAPWSELLAALGAARPAGVGVELAGYVPEDEDQCWRVVVLSADPGVLEINLPPCRTWAEYDGWLRALERAQQAAGLRTWKHGPDGRPGGTGGGHHLLFGGATAETNPLFTRPGWVASLVRFWQHHPSLSYLFTGCYVGAASQAPRPDESGKTLADWEMACTSLEALPPGADHRAAITDTLIHLHSDAAGNTHRAEMSFDKFWNTSCAGGARGLIEFRALETLPRAAWSSAVALLWRALAAHLLARPFRAALVDHGRALHDRFFLPSLLWSDFLAVLGELEDAGWPCDRRVFRAIWEWRFPVLLAAEGLTVRRGLEAWPLLCETPLEGGTTSRFVDTSMARLEFAAGAEFTRPGRVRINGRPLELRAAGDGLFVAGLRYRASALRPSLHPSMPVQLPLVLDFAHRDRRRVFALRRGAPRFTAVRGGAPPEGPPCRAAHEDDWCYDLRLE